jgi:uncharacterized protein with HEPN domain
VPSERLRRRFEDILENVARIESFTAGHDAASFAGDEKTVFAVLHALLIVSEAARKLGREAEAHAPGQPWPAIRAIGNILRHQYDDVDPVAIWRIVSNDLPNLRAAIERVLSALR